MDSSSTSYNTRAASTRPPGRLRRFRLPPFSVILVSILMALLLSQVQVDLASTAPLPTERALSKALPPEEGIANLFTPEVKFWEEDILAWSKEYQLDPNLIATVMQIESCGYSRAKSSAGAKGLFQVMPDHFKKKEDPYQPDTNAHRGLSYLRKSLETGGNPRLALAGYNGGITGAKSPEDLWPNETQRYVYWGLQIYRDAKVGKYHSTRLDDWLSRGGAHLCRKAWNEQNNEQNK